MRCFRDGEFFTDSDSVPLTVQGPRTRVGSPPTSNVFTKHRLQTMVSGHHAVRQWKAYLHVCFTTQLQMHHMACIPLNRSLQI
ncbi:hypothetical protein NDU88_009809 [Pleurodeles waltl]|uniref:Uncharacterized protein n=1 Tax=Pleurodeles waltl TaxID=8319 RepID=A0AAV7RWB2_PLEWA|nr:hypothetical protein NDU88_009809 [Pleurodeles waltl]